MPNLPISDTPICLINKSFTAGEKFCAKFSLCRVDTQSCNLSQVKCSNAGFDVIKEWLV